MEIEKVEILVDEALSSGQYESSPKALASVVLALCERLPNGFTPWQQEYLEAAKIYWGGGLDEKKRIELLERQGRILDECERNPDVSDRTRCLERLIWSALVTTTPLDQYAGSFLIDLAAQAGLTPDEIYAAFEAQLPGLQA